MRKKLIKWHLFAGLLCFPYFIIFGISSLNFNHHFQFMEPGKNIIHWQRQIIIPPFQDEQQFADAIRDSLGLIGWSPPWEIKKDTTGFRFMITHPGKTYAIKIVTNEKIIRVEETRKGFWSVFNSLHGFNGEIPGAPALINSWGFYSDIIIVVMLFSIISGIYIFLKRKSERKTGLIILFSCIGLSLLIMLSAWL